MFMKKSLVLFLCLSSVFGVIAQEKYKAQWSLAVEAGMNRFDGDVYQSMRDVIPTASDRITFGASIERTFTPLLSLGVDYFYIPFSADRWDQNSYKFNTKSHNATFFTSFNVLRAFFPYNSSKWGIWTNLGLGYASYDVDYQTKLDDDGTPDWVRGGNGGLHLEKDTLYNGRAMTIPLGLLFEYNFTKNIALGLRYQYRAFNKDNLEGRNYQGVTNDFAHLTTLVLRFKFKGKSEKHTRNPIPEDAPVTKKELNDIQNQIDGLVVPVPVTTDPRIDDLDKRLKKLEDYLDIDGPDDDNDGVANSRDQEPNTPAGNQVDFWGRTIPKGSAYDPAAFIFFDFDKTDLDEEAHKAIRIAAEKLTADPELLVEVRGFTDNMGTNAYNANLSQRRADKVKNELVNAYGIEADRIVANGKGKYNPDDRTIPYRPYRTAAFFYSK